MKTQFIRNFIKLTDSKNFSKSAKELEISQSTLSNQILQLEKELDVSLIERSTRTFELTKGGEIFLKHAKNIIDILDTCKLELSEHKLDQTEEIIISASTLPGSHMLPMYITDFKNKYPNVEFKIIINNSQKSIDLLNEKNADFAGIGSFMGVTVLPHECPVCGRVFIASVQTLYCDECGVAVKAYRSRQNARRTMGVRNPCVVDGWWAWILGEG